MDPLSGSWENLMIEWKFKIGVVSGTAFDPDRFLALDNQ